MTELANRPALSAPSNIYDPGVEDFTERVHERIRADLSTLGTVYRISGTVAATTRHGVRLDQVRAYVENHYFRIPLILDVRWDADSGQLRYYTVNNGVFRDNSREFTPLDNGYGTGVLSAQEREVVNNLFERMRNHPAVTWPEEYHRLNTLPGNALTLAGVGATSGSMVASGALMGLDILGPWAMMSVPVVGAMSYLTNRKLRAEFNAAYDTYRDAAAWWNGHRDEVIPALLDGRGEMTMFLDALLSLCEQHGVAYQGQLQVHNTVSVKRGETPITHAAKFSEDPFYGDTALRSPAVSFIGEMHPYAKPQWIMFDGNHLYHFTEGRESLKRESTVKPLSAVNTEPETQARQEKTAERTHSVADAVQPWSRSSIRERKRKMQELQFKFGLPVWEDADDFAPRKITRLEDDMWTTSVDKMRHSALDDYELNAPF